MMKNFLGLNPKQWEMVYKGLFTGGSPLIMMLLLQLGVVPTQAQAWVDAAQYVLPLIGMIWMAGGQTNAAQVNAIAAMPPEVQAQAFAKVSPEVKAGAAASMDGVTVVADPSTAPLAVVAMAHDPDQPGIVSTGEHKS